MGDVDIIGADEIENGSKDFDKYKTIACFIYGGDNAVSNLSDSVLSEIKTSIEHGATFISNREVCGGKVYDYLGLRSYGELSGWYPALKDSQFVVDYSDEKLFKGVAKYSENPQGKNVSYWTSGDYDNLIFRVDNSKSYTGRYGATGNYLVEPNKYLAKGFGTGFSVGAVSDKYFPEWKIGDGAVIQATGLKWTFNQENKSGGYIGIAGRQILQNIVEYVHVNDSNSSLEKVNLDDGLVAHYEFEGDANDSSGNGNNGTEYGGVTYSDGIIGKAASFDGVDDYIDTSINDDLRQFSISVWIKNKTTFENKFGIIDKFNDWRIAAEDGDGETWLKSGGLEFGMIDSNQTRVGIGYADTKIENWLHVVAIYSSNKLSMFVNNKLINEAILTNRNYTQNTILVGVKTTLSEFFNGLIDDLRIYNRALNEAEIQKLYKMGQNDTASSGNSFMPVLKTGQTTSYYANDDGDLQRGTARSYTRDDTKEVVVDNVTNLMWQDDADAKTVKKNWQDAKDYCQNLTLGGYSNWRLPDIEELYSITDIGRYNLAIDPAFQNVVSNLYWSSSTYVSYTSYAWVVLFGSGNDSWDRKSNSYYVRCVRDNH